MNDLIDEMNRSDDDTKDEGDDEGKTRFKPAIEVSSRKVGAILKAELQLRRSAQRSRKGIRYAWHEMKMISHAMRYGLNWEAEVAQALMAAEIPGPVREMAERHGITAERLTESALLNQQELQTVQKASQKGFSL